MKTKYKILIATTPSVFILDQITKLIVEHSIVLGNRIPVILGFFDIVHFRNTGAAFGIFSGVSDSVRIPLFYIVAVVAVVSIAWFYRSIGGADRLLPVAFSLIFGGIAGNIADRLRLNAVIDFLSFHIGDRVVRGSLFGKGFNIQLEWPAFNVADSAITIAIFLLLFGFRGHDT